MKKLIFTLIIILIAVSACKKSSSSSNGFAGTISAIVDGNEVTFNNSSIATMHSLNGGNFISINKVIIDGYQGTVDSSNMIEILLSSSSPIVAGSTFSDTSTNSAAFEYIQYPDGVVYNNLGDGSTKVTITSISATNVQGTFVSNVSGSGTPSTHIITNGTFNLKLGLAP